MALFEENPKMCAFQSKTIDNTYPTNDNFGKCTLANVTFAKINHKEIQKIFHSCLLEFRDPLLAQLNKCRYYCAYLENQKRHTIASYIFSIHKSAIDYFKIPHMIKLDLRSRSKNICNSLYPPARYLPKGKVGCTTN